MLYRFEDELRGAAIHARDGSIGSVNDFHFDERDWVVRYLVVDTGTWLPGRLVVVSPAAVERFDRSGRAVEVNLTREQIENGPTLGIGQPLSAEQEAALAGYYGWPIYGAMLPIGTQAAVGTETVQRAVTSRLLSARGVMGNYIRARDGDLGHVYDFVLEDFIWAVRYLAIDTRNWWPGKKVLVARTWIRRIDWAGSVVHVDLTREQIRNSPAYNPSEPISRNYEKALWTHYGHPPYWEEE